MDPNFGGITKEIEINWPRVLCIRFFVSMRNFSRFRWDSLRCQGKVEKEGKDGNSSERQTVIMACECVAGGLADSWETSVRAPYWISWQRRDWRRAKKLRRAGERGNILQRKEWQNLPRSPPLRHDSTNKATRLITVYYFLKYHLDSNFASARVRTDSLYRFGPGKRRFASWTDWEKWSLVTEEPGYEAKIETSWQGHGRKKMPDPLVHGKEPPTGRTAA